MEHHVEREGPKVEQIRDDALRRALTTPPKPRRESEKPKERTGKVRKSGGGAATA